MHVFVYGTLTDPDRVADVLGDVDGMRDPDDDATDATWSFVCDATLRGLHRVDGRYPTLAPGGRVDGRILDTDAVDALDAYEGVDRGLYVRVRVPTADDAASDDAGSEGAGSDDAERDDGAVAVYVGDPDRLDPVEPVSWPGDGDLERRVRRYVDASDVVVERT